jgi:hypothetical protein
MQFAADGLEPADRRCPRACGRGLGEAKIPTRTPPPGSQAGPSLPNSIQTYRNAGWPPLCWGISDQLCEIWLAETGKFSPVPLHGRSGLLSFRSKAEVSPAFQEGEPDETARMSDGCFAVCILRQRFSLWLKAPGRAGWCANCMVKQSSGKSPVASPGRRPLGARQWFSKCGGRSPAPPCAGPLVSLV